MRRAVYVAALTIARKQTDTAVSQSFSAVVDERLAGEWSVTTPAADPPAKKV